MVKKESLSDWDESYIEQMQAWLKEQEAREKQILNTIETSGEIVRQNKIQLEWHRKTYQAGLTEFEDWKKTKEIE